MCKWGTHKTVHCPAGFNNKNKERVMVPIDACIADIVEALNDAGLFTLDSCCAHGKGDGLIRLIDGRKIFIK